MSGNRKTSWPELKGVPAQVAKRKILADRPDTQVVVLPEGSFVTMEFKPKRVRAPSTTPTLLHKSPRLARPRGRGGGHGIQLCNLPLNSNVAVVIYFT
ncbi:hypothetical protein PR202_ga04262 [Eleusine coracana subsp. coracana]|uniref:Uncharacterized protein n=1 Tax=Eleusine coracana subsp. coracana TaxID=191504 RepID=A0AAV5BSM0_ELECO|nr:hypothetical protein PR202_ga04262 [Eleusine coracana subsp. coracana]